VSATPTRRRVRRGVTVGAVALALSSLLSPPAIAAEAAPISLYPQNPHYFSFRGRPTALITSGEHYGAVLNPDFDFRPYLDELRRHRFNLTRLFSGTYVERDSSIPSLGYNNTLAPRPGRLLAPWARSSTPGYAGGGDKFDLSRFDPRYFARLKDFVAEAGRRGVVVELSLFCAMYGDNQWSVSPMNGANNVNGVGAVAADQIYQPGNGGLLPYQEQMARKIVRELSGFDNVYYELVNEPYWGDVSPEWQRTMAATIADEQRRLGRPHLIAQNIANGSAAVGDPDPNVSVLNFHYANPPTAVTENYGLGRVVAFDESGFRGTGDDPYRTEAWEFLMAGGGVYDNLDWSYTPAHPDGTAALDPATPGGGSPTLRDQLSALRDFVYSLPFAAMKPDDAIVQGGPPDATVARALAAPGRAYAAYLNGAPGQQLTLAVAAGRYRLRFVDPRSGRRLAGPAEVRSSGTLNLRLPDYGGELAVSLLRDGN
jgi:hypothetical protein